MCGICGIVSIHSNVDFGALSRMAESLRHRGPDGLRLWMNDGLTVGLGHNRLSIIDLSDQAGQPMFSADGRHVIIFNGEIYNYIELKQALSQEGKVFNTQSDTEVLLTAYITWGESFLRRLDGMFSFAIWDNLEKKLFAARDRFGEKPFFYSTLNNQLHFASEMKALWAAGVSRDVCPVRLQEYLRERWVDDPQDPGTTFYKRIQQLPAAHCLSWERGQMRIFRYWDLPDHPDPSTITFEDARERFSELLNLSVRRRLRSDVAVGSSLSGGLDSSTIVSIISRLQSSRQHTFSARFKDFSRDEGPHIESLLATVDQVESHICWPDSDQLVQTIDQVFYHQEEPFNSASVIAQWEVMRLAQSHRVPVLLDGQGADELLAGYLPYYRGYLRWLFLHHPTVYFKELEAYQRLHGSVLPATSALSTTELSFYLKRVRRKMLGKFSIHDALNLRDQLKFSLCRFGLRELLRYADRNAMGHGIEVRLPFLSHELVEFVHTLPDSYKLSGGWTKLILRRSQETSLPTSIAWRKDKVGYEPPQVEWLKHPRMQQAISSYKQKLTADGILWSSYPHVGSWEILMLGKLFAYPMS